MNHRLLPGILALVMMAGSIHAVEPPASWQGLNTVVNLLAKIDDPAAQADVLRGVTDALKGRRQVPMPQEWRSIYPKLQTSPSAEVRDQSAALALQFGDADAISALRHKVADAKADPTERLKAIDALAAAHDIETGKILLALLDDVPMRATAIRGLAGYSEAATPGAILDRYAKLNDIERRDAVNTLASRAAWAAPLLDAVEKGQIPHADISAFTVRQLGGLHDHAIDERLKKFYGGVRPPAKDKAKLIATYRKTFTPDMLAKADLSHGRAVFAKTCAVCHTLFDAGGKVGPELTGSQRANLDYVLENVVDPSAVVAKDYYMTVIETNDGRTLTGIVKSESEATLTLRDTVAETTLPKGEIKSRRTSAVSMMPEGLLEALSLTDARDLIAYLASPAQVPLKAQ
jgi:putative heme-binding domain-containing protein